MLEMIRPKSRLLVMSNLTFDSGRTHSTQQSTTSLDNVERYTGVDQSGDTFNRNVGLDLTYEGYLGSKLRWSTKAAWTSESAQTERVRLDTVSSTPMRTIASIAPLATGHNVKATVGLQSMPNARHFFSLTYDYSYIYSVDKMTSVDWSGNETP